MKSIAMGAFLLLFLSEGFASASVRWTDKEGKVHLTQRMPKQDQVTKQEWERLHQEKSAVPEDGEKLPDLAAGVILTYAGKDGEKHSSNKPPLRSEVAASEWKRLQSEIPKLNQAANQPTPEVPKKEEAAPEPAAEGEALPDLPSGKTLTWTGRDGKSHMTSTPPSRAEVTKQEWERLKGAIQDLVEEAKSEAENPPPAPEATKSEGGPASLGPASLDKVSVTCNGRLLRPGKYQVKGEVKNNSAGTVRGVRLTVDILSDRKPIELERFEPVKVAVLTPGESREYRISFDIPTAYLRSSLSCEARLLDSSL